MTIIRTIIALIILTSCSDAIDNEKLIGRYVMAKDTLELLPNKTFRHFFNNRTNSGTWKLNSTGNEISFDNFSFNSDKGNGIWYSRIILTNDEIHINVNSDISDGYFNKISDK